MTEIRYVDIGLNLFGPRFPDPALVLDRAEAAGVLCILTGTDMDENARIAGFLPGRRTWGTCGIHPHASERAEESDYREMLRILREEKGIVAVGECGLDYEHRYAPVDCQARSLERQLELAEETEKPLFLHERGAAADLAAVLKRHPSLPKRSVVHCFTGNRKEMDSFLDMGMMIGITGWICDERRNHDLLEAVKYLPSDRVMLETDAPYLLPRGIPGLDRTNRPEYIQYVCRALAEAMDMETETLRKQALRNTEQFFRLEERGG